MFLKVCMQSRMSPAYSNQDVGSKKSNVNLKAGGFDAPVVDFTRKVIKEAIYVGKQAIHVVEKGFDAVTSGVDEFTREKLSEWRSRIMKSGSGGEGWIFTERNLIR